MLSNTFYNYFISDYCILKRKKDKIRFKSAYGVKSNYCYLLGREIARKKSLSKKKASQYIASIVLDYLVKEKNYKIIIEKNNKKKSRVLRHDECEAFLIALLVIRQELEKDFIDGNAFLIHDLGKRFHSLEEEIERFEIKEKEL